MSFYFDTYLKVIFDNDSAIQLKQFKQLRQTAKQLGLYNIENAITFNLVDVYEKNNDFINALQCYLQMEDVVKQSPIIFNDRYIYGQYTFARLFYRFGDYDKAIQKIKPLFSRSVRPINKVFIADLLGNCYLKLNQPDSALYWFQLIKKIIPASDSGSVWHYSIWYSIVDGNCGKVAKAKGDIKTAKQLLTNAIQQCEQLQYFDNVAPLANELALIYLIEKNNELALKTLTTNFNACKKLNSVPQWFSYYKALHQLCILQNNNIKLKSCSDSLAKYEYLQQQLVNQDKKNGLLMLQKIKELQLEADLISAENKRLQLIRNFIIALIILLIFIVYLVVRKNKQQRLLTNERIKNAELIANEKAVIAETQIADFIIRLKEKNELIEGLENKIQVISTNSESNNNKPNIEILEQLQSSCILTEDDWIKFKALYETAYPGYITKLKSFSIKLSPAEIRLLVLSKLNLNNKEIANVLGIGSEAVRVTRSRLKKKLEQNGETNLEDLS
jgi:hypothetical protein